MKCQDFERIWNERLDDRDGGDSSLARVLEDHASACSRCASVHSRYLVLSQGLRVLAPLPTVSERFAERVLAAHALTEAPGHGAIRPFVRYISGLAAAAVLIVAVTLGFRSWKPGHGHGEEIVAAGKVNTVDTPVALSDVLAVARVASLEFAREASAPAARVGYELASTEFSDPSPSPSLAFSVDVAPATRALQRVGDRLNAGVRPLEGSARHAFGFLIGPDTDRKPSANRSPRG